MKKTLFAVTILLGVGFAASAQDAKSARPKKTATTQSTTVQKAQKPTPLVAETVTDEQIRMDKIKAKEAAKKSAKKAKASVDTNN